MAKKSEIKGEKKTALAIFVEGDTEVEFYKKLLASIRSKVDRCACTVDVKNLKGIGNYKDIAVRIFENGIRTKYPNCRHVIVLCFDTDVFAYSGKPPVVMSTVKKALLEKDADQVEFVRADKSIEDWFLLDMNGLRKLLKIPSKTKLRGYKGEKGLEQLFLKANKVYIKGVKCQGLVDALDMDKILPHICSEIKIICQTMGVNCGTENERCK